MRREREEAAVARGERSCGRVLLRRAGPCADAGAGKDGLRVTHYTRGERPGDRGQERTSTSGHAGDAAVGERAQKSGQNSCFGFFLFCWRKAEQTLSFFG
jgi:hypothetical protein